MALTRVRASQIIGLTGQYAPILNKVIPDSYLPSTSGNFILEGAFFTPDMSIAISGTNVINTITFVTDNKVILGVTTSDIEGSYSITLNNGIEAVFSDALLVVLGDVFTPIESEYINVVEPIDLSVAGQAILETLGVVGKAEWNRVLDFSKQWELRFSPRYSPINPAKTNDIQSNGFVLTDLVNGDIYKLGVVLSASPARGQLAIMKNGTYILNTYTNWTASVTTVDYRIIWNGVQLSQRVNNGPATAIPTSALAGNLKLEINVKNIDLKNIKYIELAT